MSPTETACFTATPQIPPASATPQPGTAASGGFVAVDVAARIRENLLTDLPQLRLVGMASAIYLYPEPTTKSTKEALDLNSYARAEAVRIGLMVERVKAARVKVDQARYALWLQAYAIDATFIKVKGGSE